MSAALALIDGWKEEPKPVPLRARIYLAASRRDEASYDPNATTAANSYDRARRILTLINRQGSAPVSSYSYTYDSNGRGRVDAIASGTQRRTPCG